MAAMRKVKNVVNNYSPAEVKVREATSNDPWGPSSSVMSELADMTYNVVAFSEIMTMVWKRINDHGKNWRHVYKALVLLDYIIKTGSDRVAQQCRENIFAIQTLQDFHFYDRDGKDQGMNVREKSKGLVSLLKDEERLKTERERALKAKERFAMASQGIGSGAGAGGTVDVEIGKPATETTNPERTPAPTELEQARPHTAGEEELQLQLAIAMSKEEAQKNEIDQKHDDLRLQMALSESADQSGELPMQVQPPAHQQQTTSTLLNLVETPTSLTAPKPDPWGVQAQPSIPANDPWGASAAVSSAPAVASDPWGTGPSPQQPSLPQQSVTASGDPWGAPPPVQQTVPPPAQVDAWGVPVGSQPPAHDPWASQGQALPPRPPQDPDNEFDMLRNDGMLTSSSSMMAQSAPIPMGYPTQPQTNGTSSGSLSKTKPEEFLGENSKLVNLDSLVGPVQKGPTLTASNPFLMTGGAPPVAAPLPTGAVMGGLANPFHQQRAPAPSINQLRQQPFQQPQNQPSGSFQTSFAAGGNVLLPAPLIPASSAPHGDPQNPFL